MLGRLAPAGLENSVQGVRSAVSSLGALAGSVVGGAVLQSAGPDALYRGAGVLVSFAGFGYLCSESWCGDKNTKGVVTTRDAYRTMEDEDDGGDESGVEEEVDVTEDANKVEPPVATLGDSRRSRGGVVSNIYE